MKKQSSPKTTNTKFMEIYKGSRSWHPIMRNKWIVKFSEHKGKILLIFVSSITSQTIIRYFADEDDAVMYINYILLQDASEEIPC